MSLFSKPTYIDITSANENPIWSVPVQGIESSKVIVRVGNGCQAILYADGHPKVLNCGPSTFAWRKDLKGKAVNLIGINLEKKFTIRMGAGGVPYRDWETGETVEVGVRGECDINILDARAIINLFGGGVEKISIDDVRSSVLAKMQEFLKTKLSKVLIGCGYTEINSRLDEFSGELQKAFREEFSKDGLNITRCSIVDIVFPADYKERRQAVLQTKAEAKEQKKQRDKDQELLEKLFEQSHREKPDQKEGHPARGKAGDAAPVYCPRCGGENPPGNRFCTSCGSKLN